MDAEQKQMIEKFTGEVKAGYEGNRRWKEESDSIFFGKEWAKEVAQLFKDDILTDRPGKVTILSPTANSGSNEADIFDEIKRSNNVHFIAGDIADVALDRRILNGAGPDYARLDALNLPFKNNSVDIIFDKKGLLWHACVDSIGSEKKTILFKKVLEEFTRILSEKDGSIIIDAIEEDNALQVIDKEETEENIYRCKKIYKGNEDEFLKNANLKRFLAFRRNNKMRDVPAVMLFEPHVLEERGIKQFEHSTYATLMYLLEINEDLKKYFTENFELRLIGDKEPHLLAEIVKKVK